MNRSELRFKAQKMKSEYYAQLNAGRVFKDIHTGKRCFILGNGPSLNDMHAELIAGEYVFAVNTIYKWEQFDKLAVNYYVIADPAFYGKNSMGDKAYDREFLLSNCKKIHSFGIPVFFPLDASNYMKSNNFQKDTFYFYPAFDFGEMRKIDITMEFPIFRTVVQYALCIAIYMGFSEIYLLGCDTSTILPSFQHLLGESAETSLHAYKDKVGESYLNRVTDYYGMEHLLYQQYEMFKAYRQIFEYCSQRGILLKNLSTRTALDMIPRDSVENIIRR